MAEQQQQQQSTISVLTGNGGDNDDEDNNNNNKHNGDDMSLLWETMLEHNRSKDILEQVYEYSKSYLDTMMNDDDRPVYPSPHALQRLEELDEPLPDHPYHDYHDNDPQTSSTERSKVTTRKDIDVLTLLHDIGSSTTVAQGGGRYFGFVNGGVLPTALGARILADVWDQNASLFVMSPIASTLEDICERWIVEMLGLPATTTAAGFASGTSTATMIGLLVGRNAILRQQGWDVLQHGLFGAPPIRVVTSQQAHGTVRKALSIIGIGNAQIEWIPVDDQGRLDINHLPELDNNTLVILQAGNVNSGSFDPFRAVCDIANRVGAWVHIDGAFGLWAAACQSTKYLTDGIELANSWSVDGHKTLNTPYDNGIVLCKDRSAMVSALQASGSYLQFGGDKTTNTTSSRDNMLYVPEMSRRARGVEVWAVLKTLGRSGVDSMITRLCHHAKLFAQLLPDHGFRILNDVVFNQVIVACETSELTQMTLKHIQNSGVCWCSGSKWLGGEHIIRISVCSWVTTEDDVHRSVQAFANAYQKAKET